MKKYLVCLLVFSLLLSIAAWNEGVVVATAHYHDPAISNILPSGYHQPPQENNIEARYEGGIGFDTTEELIEWVRTVDVEIFQGGRFNIGVLSLRERGQILIPSFECSNTVLRDTSIFPHRWLRLGCTSATINRRYIRNNVFINVSLILAVDDLFMQTGGNIMAYAFSLSGDNAGPFETLMTVNEQERVVSYATLLYSRGTSKTATFLVEGFELQITKDRNAWDDHIFQDLHLTMYDIATGLPVDGAPTATPPPNGNNGENGVETLEPTPTVEPTPTPPLEPTPTIEPTSDVSNDERETSPLGLVVAISLGLAVGGAVLWLLLWKRRGREEGNN